MTRKDILDNIRSKDKINIYVIRTTDDLNLKGMQFVYDNIKSKIEPLIEKIKLNNRFNVIESKSINDLTLDNYKKYDLIIPTDPYKNRYKDSKLYNILLKEKKLFFSPYAFDVDWNWNDVFKESLFGICRKYDYLKKPNHIIETGIPFEEKLHLPKESFDDPWNTTDKKRILICPHWSLNGGMCDYTSFLQKYDDICTLEDYIDEVEFIVRPHPLLYYSWSGITDRIEKFVPKKILKDAYNKLNYLAEIFEVNCDEDYLSYFKYSDAMIHDCGSFRCEYLYMNKPVCFMMNKKSLQKINVHHTEISKDAINCHEICMENESLHTFVENVLNNKDEKKKLREQHIEKYCKYYPNNKTPSQNIINFILGQEEYKELCL